MILSASRSASPASGLVILVLPLLDDLGRTAGDSAHHKICPGRWRCHQRYHPAPTGGWLALSTMAPPGGPPIRVSSVLAFRCRAAQNPVPPRLIDSA